MKPNHHWALHLPDQLRDFGPVYGFWTFLGERCKIGKLCGTAAIPSRAVPCIIGMVRQKLPVRPFRRFRSA